MSDHPRLDRLHLPTSSVDDPDPPSGAELRPDGTGSRASLASLTGAWWLAVILAVVLLFSINIDKRAFVPNGRNTGVQSTIFAAACC